MAGFIDKLETDMNGLKQRNAELTSELANTTLALTGVKQELAAKDKLVVTLRQDISRLERDKAEYEALATAQNSIIGKLRGDLETADTLLNEETPGLSAERTKVKALEDERDGLKTQLDEVEAAFGKWQDESEERVASLEKDIEAYQADVLRLGREAQALRDTKESLEAKLKAAPAAKPETFADAARLLAGTTNGQITPTIGKDFTLYVTPDVIVLTKVPTTQSVEVRPPTATIDAPAPPSFARSFVVRDAEDKSNMTMVEKIIDAVKDGPKTANELIEVTGSSVGSVRATLSVMMSSDPPKIKRTAPRQHGVLMQYALPDYAAPPQPRPTPPPPKVAVSTQAPPPRRPVVNVRFARWKPSIPKPCAWCKARHANTVEFFWPNSQGGPSAWCKLHGELRSRLFAELHKQYPNWDWYAKTWHAVIDAYPTVSQTEPMLSFFGARENQGWTHPIETYKRKMKVDRIPEATIPRPSPAEMA